MSPFTPFVSEELLKYLPQNIELDLNKYHNLALEQEIDAILDICQNVRQLKSRHNITKKYDPHLCLYAHNDEVLKLLDSHRQQIQALTLVRGVQLEMLTDNSKANKDLKLFSTAGHLCSFGELKMNF